MKEKFLLFQNAGNDAMMYPLSKLKSVEAGSTALTFTFETAVTDDDTLTVTCSASEHSQLVDLATFLGGPPHHDGVYVIADDVNGVYALPGFTAVGATS
tara:strand:+ start:510 stop:806 length:297 start_codon:yes stop_codon:yes gene_type:complete